MAEMLDYIRSSMAEKDRESLRTLLNMPEGRWFIVRLLDKTKVMLESFTGNSSTFYNEGRRSVGVALINEISNLGLDGFDKRQLAEKEYILEQQRFKELFLDSLKEEEEADE